MTLSIPAGINSGDKQRIKGKGIKNASTNNVGDMYVIFKVIIPNKLSREQKDLFERLMKTDLDNKEINSFDRFVNNG